MLKHAIALIALPFLISCSSSPAQRVDAPKPTTAVIFIPGFYGTALKDTKTGDRFFITAWNYYFGKEAVSLHQQDLLTPKAPELETDGVLEKVPAIFGLINIDVYGNFISDLRDIEAKNGGELVLFPYDWRGDLHDDVQKLAQTVAELKGRGITHIRIVAHSMGCMIAAYYLAYGDQPAATAKMNWQGAKEVDKAVLMAGPYRGVFSIFRNMQTGAKLGSNRAYMPAETVASLPSGYNLMAFQDFHMLDHDLHSHTFALDDVKEWQARKLGLLNRSDLSADVRTRRMDYVTEQLRAAKDFSDRLIGQTSAPAAIPSSIQILQLVGYGHSTVDTGFIDPATGAMEFDSEVTGKKVRDEAKLYTDGDGTVTNSSARLPEMFMPTATIMRSKSPHDKIFEDVEFKKVLGAFL